MFYFFQTEDDEFEHFTDEEEFVGFDPERETTKPKEKFDLKMATVSIVIFSFSLHIVIKW